MQRRMGKDVEKEKMREGPAEGWEDGRTARQSGRRRQRQRKGRGGEEKLCSDFRGANEAGGFREG